MDTARWRSVEDDNEAVRESMRFLQDISGFDVEAFGSAQAFLARVNSRRGKLLLVDQHSAEEDHLSAAVRRAAWTGTSAGRISARFGAKPSVAARCGVLEKPIADEVLLRFIDALGVHRRFAVMTARRCRL
jgi:DNA-binding NtrC family response regulator